MTEQEILPAQSSKEPEQKPETAKPASTGLLWLFIFINFAIAIGLAGAGYWFWQQNYLPLLNRVETQQDASDELNTLNDAQSLLQASLNQLGQTQESLSNDIANATSRAQQNAQQVEGLQNQLAAMNKASSVDWLIAEAEYLTRMAGRKIWLESDTRTAILLLQEADKRVAETADPNLIPVRSIIASDIQNLEQVNPVATTSIALSISGLLSTVDNLPLNTLQLPESQTLEPAEVSEDVSDWQENLSRVWHAVMDDFVTIRRRDTAIEPMMSTAQQFLARERVKLSLMQAQSAALKHQVTLYQQSLQQAVASLVEHFDMEHHQVEQFLGAIANLQSTNIEKKLPQSLSSQQALEEALARKKANAELKVLAL